MNKMIKRVIIRGYRKFEALDLVPNDGLNIVVGANDSGKSTLFEAIVMALTGRHEGFNAAEALNPYWFNAKLVDEFFDALDSVGVGDPLPELPKFRIELYLEADDGELQKMRGIHNSRSEDSVGLSIQAVPDHDYLEDIEEYFREKACPRVIPVEYYRLEWRDFADQAVYRRPKGVGAAVIDTRTIRSNRGMDYYTREMVEEFIDSKVRNKVSVEHRKMRASLGDDLLDSVNEELDIPFANKLGLKIGIQVDQSRATSWANTLVPEVERIPFSQSGKGTQAVAKTALAMEKSTELTSHLLIEEPENHLSHTRLRQLLAHIDQARGDRQVFVTTHSSFVLNRLGLEQLLLLDSGFSHPFSGLSDDTANYFKRISGFDTLRVVLADKIVLVEGPSDEIVFNRFFADELGFEPLDAGVDVMSLGGVAFRRSFELAHMLDRDLFALRDNDGQTPEHWQGKLEGLLAPGKRELFVGESGHGDTLESQISNANDDGTLRRVLGIEAEDDPTAWMLANKTEAALRIAGSGERLNPPKYIKDAINVLKVGS